LLLLVELVFLGLVKDRDADTTILVNIGMPEVRCLDTEGTSRGGSGHCEFK